MGKSMRNRGEQIPLERTYAARVEDVWDLWTTREGIESWWGPEGFAVRVRSIDLRPGGKLRYAMSAVAPEMVAFMEREGMPTEVEHELTYAEVSKNRRLAYRHLADFIPGVEPYEVEMVVDLQPTEAGTRLSLTLERMHDDEWTQRQVMGWESELDKLARELESRAGAEARP